MTVCRLPRATIATFGLGTVKPPTLRIVLLLQRPNHLEMNARVAAIELLGRISYLACLGPLTNLLVVVLRDLSKVHMRACLVVHRLVHYGGLIHGRIKHATLQGHHGSKTCFRLEGRVIISDENQGKNLLDNEFGTAVGLNSFYLFSNINSNLRN